MALTPSRTGRLLLLLLCAWLPAACATATASSVRPTSLRWVLLGDRGDAGDLATLVADQSLGVAGRPRITDLSVRDAGIEAVIQQLALLPERSPDRFLVRLGEADAAATTPLSPARYGELVAALLITLRHRAPVAVTTIPERTPVPGTVNTLTTARRLRLAAEYNEAIRAAARLHDATVVEATPARGEAAGLWPSGAALDALRVRAAHGAALGLQPDVIAKVGDSITSSPAFLSELTEAVLRAGDQERLVETFRRFTTDAMTAEAPGHVSPFARESLAARDRWSIADVLAGGDRSPLAREIEALRPGVAVAMFGTNDLTHLPVSSFEEQLDRLLTALEQRGVVALLSTIPERRDAPLFGARVPPFNRAIRALARVHGVPVVDYHAAMADLPNAGLAPDGIHPSACPDGPGALTPHCLRYGYNLRNLLTLQALDRLHADLAGPFVELPAESTSGR